MSLSEDDSISDAQLLIGIEEIRQMKARYWRFLDTKQWDDLFSLFTDDATFSDRGMGFTYNGREEIEEKFTADLGDVTTIHHGNHSEIQILNPVKARGIWSMEDIIIYPHCVGSNTREPRRLHGYGYYFDDYVKIQNSWRVQRSELFRLHLTVEHQSRNDLPAGFL